MSAFVHRHAPLLSADEDVGRVEVAGVQERVQGDVEELEQGLDSFC